MYGTSFDIEDKVLDENFTVPIGKAKIMRQGKDLTLVSHSIGVGFCMDAADLLAKDGISVEVVNLRSIRPLDINTVNESVMKTNHLITVEGNITNSIYIWTKSKSKNMIDFRWISSFWGWSRSVFAGY